ncbi:MAG TPA: transglycosylase SLT domain-containing protein [Pyrinomonadaceae bacterium]|nr:transglycosylase SLT domain-containing protein [Pyrinomonadaceae bacterium]
MPSGARLKFSEMWSLVDANRYGLLFEDLYPNELLVAIMWEESTFRNIREVGNGSHATGFGQVNDTEFWRFPEYGNMSTIRNKVLGDPGFSVKIVGMFIYDLHKKLGSREKALKAYAGVGAPGADQHNQNALNHWKECERLLIEAPYNFQTQYGDWVPIKSTLRKCLHAAKPNADGYLDDVLSDIDETPTDDSGAGDYIGGT